MNKKEFPETLYKFRDWSNEYNRRLLVESELYFSNHNSFNDPFDLLLPVLISGEPPFDRDQFIEVAKEKLGRLPTEEEIRTVKERYPQLVKDNPDIIEDGKKEFEIKIQEIENRLGVFCLSEKSDSSLMWGHYSKSHQGFCVGLDYAKLDKYINETFPKRGRLFKVNYETNIPIVEFSAEWNEIYQYCISRCYTKFRRWSYENEVRIIVDHMANKAHKIPKDIFKEVIFGYKMNETQKKEVRILCDNLYPEIKYFKSEPNSDKFEMKITQIE